MATADVVHVTCEAATQHLYETLMVSYLTMHGCLSYACAK